MKKVKRFLTALLCVCLLAGVMAPAASAVTILTIINLTVTAPAVGKKPADTTASVPDHAHSVVKELEWSGDFDSDGAFKAGEKYTATVTMGIKKGEDWKFSPKATMNVKVNGKAADKVYYINDGELEVVYTFPKLASSGSSSSSNSSSSSSANVLTSAEITMTAPETGKTPAKTAKVPSGAAYTVKSVEWTGSLSNGKFKENTSYTAYITLGIKSSKNAVFSDDVFDADVNGYIIDEIRWVSPTEIIVPVEFEKTASAPSSSSSSSSKGTAISTIRLTVTAPVWGKKPSTTASVPSTANSTVQSVKWSGEMDTDGTFMPRVKYTVTVTMGVKAGSNHYFSDKSINGTVNGKTADEVRWYSNDKVEVIYTFPETNTGTTGIISVAKLTIDSPAAGEKPASTAHIASTASTYVKSVRWEGALDSNGRFQAGTEYTAYVTLGMKDNGRKFSTKSFDATVNGVLINEVTRVSDTEIIIPVEFEKTPGTAPAASNNTVTASGGTATKFTDVAASSPFAAAINWAVEKGITTGKPDGTFAPGENCSNAHILTFLWRGNSSPEPKGTVEMEGFTGSEYYYKAAQWAAEQNIVEGEFNPDAPCTRSMVVTYLWTLAGKPAVSGSASFPDVASGASYAQAVAWAVQNGITTGKANGTFAPNEVCTRGQIVTFLYRAFK